GPLCGNVSEETSADPRSDYAIAHFAAEQILKRVAFGGGARTVLLRPCAVYGIPRNVESFHRWLLVPYSFPLSSVYDGKIVLKGRGTQRRNFVSADDVADTVLAILRDPAPEPWRIVNPVGPDSMSILEFARLCAEESEKITGRACAVHCAETVKPEPGDDFEFRTIHAFARGRRRIQEYVSEFVKWIVAERAAGRCYEY
ncbi:MAG: NAD-dependent epimerase/dehydratase family protein, partial [Alphaproteobacteria bacterium]